MLKFKKFLKYLLISVFLLLTLLLITAWFQKDALLDYARKEIEKSLSRAAGVRITMSAADFNLFPRPSVAAENIQILDKYACALINIQKIKIYFELLPLIGGKIEPDSISIIKPESTVTRDGSGKLEFSAPGGTCEIRPDISSEPDTVVLSKKNSATSKSDSKGATYNDIWLDISDSELVFKGESDFKINSLKVNINYSDDRLILRKSEISGLSDAGEFKSSVPLLSYDFKTSSLEGRDGILDLADSNLKFTVSNKSSAWKVDIDTSNFNLASLTALLKSIGEDRFNLNGRISGKVGILAGKEGLTSSASLDVKDFGGEIDGFKVKKVASAKLELNSSNISKVKFKVSDFRFDIGKTNYIFAGLDGNLAVDPKSDIIITGQTNVSGFEIKSPDYSLSKVSGSISKFIYVTSKNIEITGEIAAQSLYFKSPTVEVTQVKNLKLPLKIQIAKSAPVNISTTASLDSANVNYAGKYSIQDIGGVVKYSSSGANYAVEFDKLNATFNAQKVKLTSKIVRNLEQLSLNNSLIDFSPGSLGFDASISGTGDSGRIKAIVNAAELSLSKVIKFSTGNESSNNNVIKSLKADLNANTADIPTTLAGFGEFRMFMPDIQSSKIVEGIFSTARTLSLIGLIQGGESSKASGRLGGDANGQFKIRNSVVAFENIKADAGRFNVNAAGSLSFAGNINANAEGVFLQENLQMLGLNIDKLKKVLNAGRLIIPVKISGNVSNPKVEPDYIKIPQALPGLNIIEGVTGAGVDAGKGLLEMLGKPFKKSDNSKDKPLPEVSITKESSKAEVSPTPAPTSSLPVTTIKKPFIIRKK